MVMPTTAYQQSGDGEELDYQDPDYGGEKGSNTGNEPQTVGYKGKNDPFGDETHSEVKYRTMRWWYVPFLLALRS